MTLTQADLDRAAQGVSPVADDAAQRARAEFLAGAKSPNVLILRLRDAFGAEWIKAYISTWNALRGLN